MGLENDGRIVLRALSTFLCCTKAIIGNTETATKTSYEGINVSKCTAIDRFQILTAGLDLA